MPKDNQNTNANEEKKQNEFTGMWFTPQQEVTKDVLLNRLLGLEDRFAKELNSENWWDNRKEYEAQKNEKARMGVLFDAGWKKLSPEGKQSVFETLEDKTKENAKKDAIRQYSRLLKGEGKSQESKDVAKTISDQMDTITVDQVKQMADKYLTEEEKKDPRLDPMGNVTAANLGKTNKETWKAFVQALPEDAVKEVAQEANMHRTALEKPIEEGRVSQYGKEIEAAKTFVDGLDELNGEKLTPERKAELKATLDRANNMTSGATHDLESAMSDAMMGRSEYEHSMTVMRKTVAVDTLKKDGVDVGYVGKGLVFNGLQKVQGGYTSAAGEESKLSVVPPEAKEQFEKMKDYKFQIRPETKQSIKDLFAKFDKYGYDETPFVPEESTKVYGLRRYDNAAIEFRQKINSNDPKEKAEAIAAAEKMDKEYKVAQELIGDARKIFDVDNGGYYPGNVDVEREGRFPPELRADIAGVSALNGMYIMYRTLKEENLDVDTFLDDPRAFVRGKIDEKIQKLDPNNTIKGKKGAEAIFDLATPDRAIDPIGAMSLGRTIETVAKVESDPAMQKHNMAIEYAHNLTDEFVLNATAQRSELTTGGVSRLDRYLMVDEPQEDATLLGLPLYDYKTMTLNPPREFDEVGYLMEKHEDPEKYANRIAEEGIKLFLMKYSQPKRNRAVDDDNLPNDAIALAMQQSAMKYLATHPDLDKKSAAYKTLTELNENTKEFIEKKLTEAKEKDGYDLDLEDILDGVNDHEPKTSIDQYKKSNAVKHLGEAAQAKDKAGNKAMKTLQSEIEMAQKKLDGAKNEADKAKAREQLNAAQKKLDDAVSARKAELLEDFRNGNITEEYLNKRNEQLDNGKFDEKVPKMFEADNLMSKNDYLKKQFPDDYNDFSKEEQEELYQRYVERSKQAKEEFIARKYLMSEGRVKETTLKTFAEREAAEDERLLRQDPLAVQKGKKQEEEKTVTQIDVDLEDEKVVENEAKSTEKQEKTQEKEVNADILQVGDEEVGERVSIDVEDEKSEPNNDILTFGTETKTVNKDPLNK